MTFQGNTFERNKRLVCTKHRRQKEAGARARGESSTAGSKAEKEKRQHGRREHAQRSSSHQENDTRTSGHDRFEWEETHAQLSGEKQHHACKAAHIRTLSQGAPRMSHAKKPTCKRKQRSQRALYRRLDAERGGSIVVGVADVARAGHACACG